MDLARHHPINLGASLVVPALGASSRLGSNSMVFWREKLSEVHGRRYIMACCVFTPALYGKLLVGLGGVIRKRLASDHGTYAGVFESCATELPRV
jgi:hypothetical protein